MLDTFAPAKINLYLHVTGRRQDGYHFLDSLVAFISCGDRLRLEPDERFSFCIDGPFGAALRSFDSEDNLVVRAVRMLSTALGAPLPFKMTLTKNLPLASGIGGGSTDAAAALRLIAREKGMPHDSSLLHEIAAALGQDIPCCLARRSCYFRDIGQMTDPGPTLPLSHLVLVNPGQNLSTPAVYKARAGAFDSPARLDRTPETVEDLAALLKERTNSLFPAALSLCPSLQACLAALEEQQGCLLARMSGSGATCFGVFASRAAAKEAASRLYNTHPDWWVVPAFFPFVPED